MLEDKYNLALERCPISIILLNLDGEVVDINPSTEKLVGIERKEFIGKKFQNLKNIPPDVKHFLIDLYKHFKEGITYHPRDLSVKQRDGKISWFHIIPIPLRVGSEKLVQIIIQDITKKKKEEKRLRYSELKYKELTETIPDIVYEADKDMRIIYTNKSGFEKFGLTPSDLEKGIKITDLIAGGNEKDWRHRIHKALIQEKVKPYIAKTKSRDGSEFHMRTHSKAIFRDGKLVGYGGILQDITEHLESEDKLKESEYKFRTIAENALLGITIIQDDVFKYVNKRFCEIIGYSADELKDFKPKEYVKLTHPDDLEMVLKQAEIKQLGKKEGLKPHYSFRAIRKDGSQIWVENYSKTINYRGKTADLMMLIDITQQKEAEQIVKNENKRLRQLDNLRKEFFDHAAHELKTPITSVYGAAQLLLDLYSDKYEKDEKELITMIKNGSNKLKNLITNLLDISKFESGRLALDKNKHDIISVLKKSIEQISYLLNLKKHEITLETPDSLIANVDKIRIESVFTNLLSNAAKYTPPEGSIYVKVEALDGKVILSVKDNGVGFTKEELSKLFQQFLKLERDEQTVEDLNIEGTGLGLFITKQIIQLHKGTIEVDSSGRNKGATFTITFPIK